MFYDEKGKHVRTKKEILDENGNIRLGCYIVPKGENYEMTFFDSKEEIFKHSSFLKDVKKMYKDLMNQLVKNEAEKLSVFEPDGPYLATKKIGKNNPKAEEIQADNEARKECNRTVDEGIWKKNDVYVSSFYYWNNHRYPISRNWLFDCMGDMVYYVCFVAY